MIPRSAPAKKPPLLERFGIDRQRRGIGVAGSRCDETTFWCSVQFAIFLRTMGESE
jgi:hypothetical protein